MNHTEENGEIIDSIPEVKEKSIENFGNQFINDRKGTEEVEVIGGIIEEIKIEELEEENEHI